MKTWSYVEKNPDCQVFTKTFPGNSTIVVKIFATLPGISKDEVVHKASNPIEIKKSSRDGGKDIQIVEEKKEEEVIVFHSILRTPRFMSDRDYLLIRKVKKDFP